MKKETVDKILKKVIAEWRERIKKGTYDNISKSAKIDKTFLESIRRMLVKCPDDDGKKRVESMETGKTHLVPYEQIILYGLKGTDLYKYPLEKKVTT